jgi:hypothetical protein
MELRLTLALERETRSMVKYIERGAAPIVSGRGGLYVYKAFLGQAPYPRELKVTIAASRHPSARIGNDRR